MVHICITTIVIILEEYFGFQVFKPVLFWKATLLIITLSKEDITISLIGSRFFDGNRFHNKVMIDTYDATT